MNIDISKYTIPTLGTLCAVGALMVASGMRTPFKIDTDPDSGGSVLRVPENLVLDDFVPTMEEVVAKHLFVPERVATGENAFPDLVVKGVYIGTGRNAVFSLKSRPEANLRVWQGDEEAALAQVDGNRDPRKPIADFLGEWAIKSIDFAGVTLEHLITGEVETYAVEYKPAKHAKDSAQAGYGQGMVADAAPGSRPPPRRASSSPSSQPRGSVPSAQSVAGRVGAYMQRM
ncbi:MAG: hypothetical protein KAU94_07780, partial [Verrucomicrobia bacterium]|nr:hypothetical protein [Verrucomicrobiota bacterium]